MKPQITALALFVFTAISVVLYPMYQSAGANTSVDSRADARARVEVVFVLDTTGSMGGLIEAAKEKIWSIATTMAQAQPAPEIRMGLVAYRDRGDAYVTRLVDLSDDLDTLYATLMDLQADGGGDGPESVNQALYEAVHNMSWSQGSHAYKTVFLVGDAPPHMDYRDEVSYPDTLRAAAAKGIVVNAIQCGQNGQTTREWQQIAELGLGRYFQVEQAGSAVAIATPFDEKLAGLSAALDATRLYYGTAEEKRKQRHRLEAADKLHATSSLESRARRATFNASLSGADNLLGEGELIEDVASGRVDLDTIEPQQLPEPLQAMAPEAQQALIAETARRRGDLQEQIQELAEQRSTYLKQKVEELGGARGSLDHKIYTAVREQAGKKGLQYQADAPEY